VERREALERQISELAEQSAGMKAQWQAEKSTITEIQGRSEVESLRGEGTRPPRLGKPAKAAELSYGRIRSSSRRSRSRRCGSPRCRSRPST